MLRCECRRCGTVLARRTGEAMHQAKEDHQKECHPGFENVEGTHHD